MPQIVTPARVRRISGNQLALAYTQPVINIDLSNVSFKQRRNGSVVEFTFDFGTLKISLQQQIYIANDLTPCERRIWASHEQHHVDDNRDCMDHLGTEMMQYSFCNRLFQRGDWFPSNNFKRIQRNVRQEIGDAFRDLTKQKVLALDTRAEYSRVAQKILRDCPGPIMYTVFPGDNLSRIAQHYYGTQTKWKKIYDANRAVVGKNPNLIRAGMKLTIPK